MPREENAVRYEKVTGATEESKTKTHAHHTRRKATIFEQDSAKPGGIIVQKEKKKKKQQENVRTWGCG